jgi:hypothetical protein
MPGGQCAPGLEAGSGMGEGGGRASSKKTHGVLRTSHMCVAAADGGGGQEGVPAYRSRVISWCGAQGESAGRPIGNAPAGEARDQVNVACSVCGLSSNKHTQGCTAGSLLDKGGPLGLAPSCRRGSRAQGLSACLAVGHGSWRPWQKAADGQPKAVERAVQGCKCSPWHGQVAACQGEWQLRATASSGQIAHSAVCWHVEELGEQTRNRWKRVGCGARTSR